jgi:hypothetical protein
LAIRLTINSSLVEHSILKSEITQRLIDTANRFRRPSETKIPPLLYPDSDVTTTAYWGSITMRIFRSSIVIAAAIVIVPLWFPDAPRIVVSLVHTFGLGSAGTGQSNPINQSTADAETLMPVDKQAQTRNETAAYKAADQRQVANAEQSQAENSASQSDVLFKQFQSWAAAQAAQNAPAKAAQSASTRFAENPRAPIPLVKKHRVVVRNERSEPPIRSPRKPPEPVQNAQAQVPSSLSAEPQWTPRSQ